MAKADTEFARTAVALKLVTQEQALECLQLYAQQRKQGARVTLASVFVQKGYLTRAQVGAVVKASRQPRISHIGRYKLIAKVGQGGMGTVYKARQESLDKIVALKVLAPGLAKQKDFVERFIREAQASGQLNHPNIALGIDAGEADGYYYFAMEFVEGESLKAILQREGKLDERRALEIALAMAKALGHAAEHSIVHRDVKPGNILLATDGTPKLVDLGLAKEVRADHSITQAGIPVGTPYYISPEQVRGEQHIDIRADIYALGGTLYHMVAGRVPYDGTTAAIVMTRHLNDPVPDPREHTPELSDTVIAIINHCMAKAPDERYRTPAELCEDLEAALAGKPLPHARRIRPGPSRAAQRAAERKTQKAAQQRKLLLAGAIGAAVIALAVVLVVVLGRPKGSPTTATGVKTQHHPQTRTSRPQPRTADRPKPKTDAAVVRAKKADAVLAELVALAAADEDRARIAERFQDFILDYAGTKAAGQAKTHLAELRTRWKAEEDFTAAIAEHLREHRFAAALAALDKPPFKERTSKIEELIAALAENVRTAAADYIEQQTTRGEELVRQGDLAGAKEVFADLAKLGIEEASKASAAALARIETLETQQRQREAQRTVAKLIVEAGKAVEAGDIDQAKALLDPAKAGANEFLIGHLEQARRDLATIAQLFDAVEAELRKRAREGTRTRIKGIGRTIDRIDNGVVYSKIGRESFPVRKLLAVDIEDLGCAPSPEALPLLELYRGNPAYAREKLAETTSDAAKHVLQLANWVSAIGREGEAAQALAAARKLADGKQWEAAQAAVSKLLKDFGDTAFVEKNRADINEVAGRCAMALAALRREDETIRPFIDATDRCGDLAKAFKAHRIVGGWLMDIDNDGRLDVALDCRGKTDPRIPVFLNRTEAGSDTLVFKDATAYCGIDTVEEPICWADLDGDGDLDVVCRSLWEKRAGGRNRDFKKLSIYENLGKADPTLFKLHPQLSLSPLLAKMQGFGGFGFGNIAVLDANGDGRPDILAQFCSGQVETLTLFLSAPGPFAYRDATFRVGFARRQGDKCELPDYLNTKAYPQYVVADADNDRRDDFIMVADTAMVFLNRGGRGFSYHAKSSLAFKTFVQPNNSPLIMPACADYDNDGDMDVFVPQTGRNLLYRNDGTGRFIDAMHTAGPMATDEARSLWATWADVNNDGLPDLFVCNDQERNRLYIQKGNHVFVDKAEEFGVTGEKSEKTNFVAFGDLDRDGDLDMLVLRESGRSQLLVNPYATGRNRFYLSVAIRPSKGAIGAKVYLVRPPDQIVGMQQVCRVEGYNRQTSREAFFGVPSAGEYVVRAVLSNGDRPTERITIDPTRHNRLVLGK